MDDKLEQAREHFLQGIRHFEAHCFAEARACFEASLALAPGRVSVLANLGITHFRLGHWADAIELLQQVTVADPDSSDAWTYLGLAHEATAQWSAAVACLTRALALEPRHAALWLTLGQCQLSLGLAAPALQAFDRALATDPDFAAAWSERGSLLREMNQLEDAARCFEKALSLGADAELNSYYLASVRGTESPASPPRKYVETLFDSYAGDFQEHLVEQLQYQAHESLLRPLIGAGQRFPAVLDLGCGTGLCGRLIHPLADAVDGIDVSSVMLEEARQLGVYRNLIHADLAPFLAETGLRADLVLAADVFIYVGELTGIFKSIRRILQPAGCFALTLELSSTGQDVHLLPSLRYAHSEAYIRRLAQTHGFTVKDLFTAPLRYDQLQPVQGLYVYLY
ncbi:MAG: tetratricopeptide repeat protein [Rhodocyclaceae bacterium]|nr:tetratricopeptide repeat protein [Rhodocyclaceae bacterium]